MASLTHRQTMVCFYCDLIETGLHPILAVSFWGQHWSHPEQVADIDETELDIILDWAHPAVIRADRYLARAVPLI